MKTTTIADDQDEIVRLMGEGHDVCSAQNILINRRAAAYTAARAPERGSPLNDATAQIAEAFPHLSILEAQEVTLAVRMDAHVDEPLVALLTARVPAREAIARARAIVATGRPEGGVPLTANDLTTRLMSDNPRMSIFDAQALALKLRNGPPGATEAFLCHRKMGDSVEMSALRALRAA